MISSTRIFFNKMRSTKSCSTRRRSRPLVGRGEGGPLLIKIDVFGEPRVWVYKYDDDSGGVGSMRK